MMERCQKDRNNHFEKKDEAVSYESNHIYT